MDNKQTQTDYLNSPNKKGLNILIIIFDIKSDD